MQELTQILSSATSAIEHGYFHLQIDGGDPVYRERVYCYELYHQMRLRWPTPCEFYLNGEVDKASHPILQQLKADHVKPDLLVHRPGYMCGNYAIIEVKSTKAPIKGIRKDIKNLDLFIRKVGYQRAIYLFFGYEINNVLIKRIRRIADELNEIKPIEIWFHHELEKPAIHKFTLSRSMRS